MFRYFKFGFLVSKNKLNFFKSNLNFIVLNLRLTLLLVLLNFFVIKLLNLSVSNPVVVKITIKELINKKLTKLRKK